MHRALVLAAVAALATAACSSAGDEAGGPASPTPGDAVAAFCTDWDRFDRLTNSDDGADGSPTEALIQEVVELQDRLGRILPGELDAAWGSVLDWNEPFIEYFLTTGYQEPSDEVIFDLLGGEDATIAASQARSDGYETIRTWSRTNCPAGDEATFCELWPAYDDFLESDPEPTEELIARLLAMQDGIDGVLPPELGTAWASIVDWNQAFIDLFEREGYGAVTEETPLRAFDGDKEAAHAAGEALQAGFASIRSWTGSNCADGSEHAGTFCEHWEDFAFLTSDEDAMTPDSYDEAIAVIDRVGDDVPGEIRSGWDAVVASARGFYEVLVSVNFEPDRITDDLLDQAFGSVEAAVAIERAADAGRAAIDEWALTGCGDFCARWPELRRTLDETGQPELGWVQEGEHGEGRERLTEHLRLFDIGSRLVPDEVREPWELAVAARRDWIAWWDSFDFDGNRSRLVDRWDETRVERELAVELMRDADYLIDDRYAEPRIEEIQARLIAAWQEGVEATDVGRRLDDIGDEHERAQVVAWLDGSGEAPEWLLGYWRWGPGERVGGELTASIEGWMNDHCEVITGQPGTVKVLWPKVEGVAGDSLVVAVMDRGATIEDLADPTGMLAGTCAEVQNDPWGVWRGEDGHEERWESEEFRSERWEEGGFCDFRWEEGAARLDAGEYTMLAAVVEGSPWGRVLGTATACLAFDVQIDGDTLIDMPTLPPCDVDLGGADDPWRNPPPVDPSTPGAGTLQIVFPDLVGDGRWSEVLVVVLPADTTLNDVGREQVWPAGATRTWPLEQGFAAERRTSAMTVPVAELPARGAPRGLDPHWLAGGPPVERLPLAVMAPGTYDVHVQISVHDPQEQEYSDRAKNDLCGTFEVTIAGDTVVDLPELGACPRVA